MFKLIKTVIIFLVFTALVFEFYIRIFHLYDDIPKVYLDSNNLLVYRPNQHGSYNFGNRKEIESKYIINCAGFNSIIEYDFDGKIPIIALIGDSYIEGFHQDINSSIGRKIESNNNYICYEYGISDWNLNDYFNLISSQINQFNQFEYLFIYISPSDVNYSLNDYLNSNKSKLKVDKQNSFLYKYIYSNIKLFSSANQMGFFNIIREKMETFSRNDQIELNNSDSQLKNFQEIISYFNVPYKSEKIVFMMNSDNHYQRTFLNYLKEKYFVIDLKKSFNDSKYEPYFRFDKHWNNHGRNLVAKEILNKIEELKSKDILN